jgi:uncharacterized protein
MELRNLDTRQGRSQKGDGHAFAGAQWGPSRGTPAVWVLTGDKLGDTAQALSLAKRLGWPYEIRRLRWNACWRLHNLLLGASLLSLDRRRSDPLQPPWPDLVIGVGRRSVPAARWIRKRSGGSAKLVRIGRPRAPLALFDLVLATPQYGLPDGRNVLPLAMPFPDIDAARLREAELEWRPRLDRLPRPWFALLIGGDASPYRLTVPAARQLARMVEDEAGRVGGSVLATTSPRTPADAAAAVVEELKGPRHLFLWSRSAVANPYAGYLALADRFFVTFDSASMLADAIATGRPVTALPVPIAGKSPLRRLKLWLVRLGRREGSSGSPCGSMLAPLVSLGLLKAPRDFEHLYRTLAASGAVQPPGAAPRTAPRPVDELSLAVERIKALFASDPGGPTRGNTLGL